MSSTTLVEPEQPTVAEGTVDQVADTSMDVSGSGENFPFESYFDSDETLYGPNSDSDSETGGLEYFSVGKNVLRGIGNEHATGSFDTEDDNNGAQDDDAHGEPDFKVQKITTDMQNMLAQKQINRFSLSVTFLGLLTSRTKPRILKMKQTKRPQMKNL